MKNSNAAQISQIRKNINNKKRIQVGIGLIEVLIAIVIFTLGITGILKLQTSLLKASSLAFARSTATQLAEAKIEDLRSFTTYDSSDSTVFDYTSIIGNGGGTLTATGGTGGTTCNPSTPNYTIQIGNTLYSRNWCVSNYYYDGTTLTTPTPTDKLITHKAVTVRIGWIDTDGTTQLLTYNVVINQYGEVSGGALAFYAGGSGEKPIITHTGSTDTRVTQIEVGTSSKRETLVPGSTTIDGFVSTAFQSHVYSTSNQLIRTEEFKNVACACAFNGTSTDADQTRAPSYPKWNSEEGTYRDETGPLVSGKAMGCVDDNENGSCDGGSPNLYCEICCRDHHDVPNTNAAISRKSYDPYRVGDTNADGTAKKYKGTTTAVTTGTYYDACRLKRINGYWRVFQDWNMANLVALPYSDLSDSTKKTAYATYVKDVLDAIIDADGNATSGSGFTIPPIPSTLNHTTSSNRVPLNTGETKDSSARSVYVDYIDDDFLTIIREKKDSDPPQDYLLHLPFYEVDTTSLAKWETSSPTSVSVISSSVDSLVANAGRISGVSINTSPVTISATLRLSNSGLTALSSSVDYNATANKDTKTLSSIYEVCIGCSGGGVGASCTSAVGGTLVDGATRIVYSSSSSTDCSTVAGSITCTNGVLSGNTSFGYPTCSTGGSSCTTNISGDPVDASAVITASNGISTISCNVKNKNQYQCGGLTTSMGATLTVTRTLSGASITKTLTSNCGDQTVNFP